jgi:hypothetical protein
MKVGSLQSLVKPLPTGDCIHACLRGFAKKTEEGEGDIVSFPFREVNGGLFDAEE